MEKSITASGTEAAIEVLFEPSRIGDSQATLSLSSTQGGDYTIPLFGHCLPPRPQGPYTLKVGQTISIPFKNVFPQTMQFSYSINSSAFSVRAPETLKAKKTCNMQVCNNPPLRIYFLHENSAWKLTCMYIYIYTCRSLTSTFGTQINPFTLCSYIPCLVLFLIYFSVSYFVIAALPSSSFWRLTCVLGCLINMLLYFSLIKT